MKIGFIGLGKMGANMVHRLLQGNHQVVVWDRSSVPVEELADKATNGNTSTLGNFKKLNKEDIKSILTMAR